MTVRYNFLPETGKDLAEALLDLVSEGKLNGRHSYVFGGVKKWLLLVSDHPMTRRQWHDMANRILKRRKRR